jgi:Na+-transporting NADH:ubiquinone oxidoreductase subunit A
LKHFQIKKGVWPGKAEPPAPKDITTVAAGSAALLGSDMPGLRPRFEVEEGASVAEGQTVFRDRKHPAVAYVAPIAGRISTLVYGPRRTLSACIITAEGAPPKSPTGDALDASSHAAPRSVLLERGLWPAFRTRPFGRTPDPESTPHAIFVNAVHVAPEAADPWIVLGDQTDAFQLGIRLLTKLTQGEVFVCQSRGAPVGPDAPRVTHVSFGGSLAAGLTGTHVDRLCPVGPDRVVWTIGYQDVAAIGHLFLTGQYSAQRVVAVGGLGTAPARLVRTSLGAGLAGILGSEAQAGPAAFLGRFDEMTNAKPKAPATPTSGWLRHFTTAQSALFPIRALEQSLAVDVLPIPLLRALSVGDTEAAERLGCLALVEEDVAALTSHSTSGVDFGVLLRRVLDVLMAEAA